MSGKEHSLSICPLIDGVCYSTWDSKHHSRKQEICAEHKQQAFDFDNDKVRTKWCDYVR